MREKRRERPRRCVGAPLCNRICSCRSSIRFFSVGQKNFLRQRRCCAILLRRFVLGRGRRYVERCPSWPKEHDWKSCMPQKGIWGSNPHLSATSEQSLFCSVFLCKKNIRPLPCSFSFAKSHARLTCSVVNALTTVCCRCQLFASHKGSIPSPKC